MGRCRRGEGGRTLTAMANKVSKSKTAVRAARDAVRAAQRDVLERTARNAEDLAVFFSSRERLDGVDDWLQSRVAGLCAQAEGRRAEHRRAAGVALGALRDRGETMHDISSLTGVSEKALRELIRCAEPKAEMGGADSGAAAGAVVVESGAGGADGEPAAGPGAGASGGGVK